MNKKQTTFEHKVIEAHEPLPSVQPKKPIKNPKLKMALILFAGFIGVIGLILIIRGIFFVKSPVFDNSKIVDSVNQLITNGPTNLDDLKINNPSNNNINFGKNIKTPYSPDYWDSKVWIEADLNKQKQVGYIDASSKFNAIYLIPSDAELVHLYDDESISYVVNSSNGNDSKLFAMTQGATALQITSLSAPLKFTSTYYEPSEKIFYFNYEDEKGFFHNAASGFQGKNLEIFKSDFLDQNTKIANINNSLGKIFLFNSRSGNCYVLNLKDKGLSDIKCASVKFNNQDKLFSSNSNQSGEYTTLIKGEIYLTTTNDPNRKIILTGNSGEIFTALTYHDNYLYFVTSKLEQLGQASFVANPKSINKLNLTNYQNTKITDKFPEGFATKIINSSNILYVITQLDSNSSSIEKYDPNPKVVPVSFPSSYPIPLNYWNTLEDFDNVKLLEGQYSL